MRSHRSRAPVAFTFALAALVLLALLFALNQP